MIFVICNYLSSENFLSWFCVSSQFQLVADLFHEKDDVVSSKSSRVTIRTSKSLPKAPNKDHRKTVGHQVNSRLLTEPFVMSEMMLKLVCLSVLVPSFSSAPHGDSECNDSSLCSLH